MKGYHVSNGYIGFVRGEGYRLSETESAFISPNKRPSGIAAKIIRV